MYMIDAFREMVEPEGRAMIKLEARQARTLLLEIDEWQRQFHYQVELREQEAARFAELKSRVESGEFGLDAKSWQRTEKQMASLSLRASLAEAKLAELREKCDALAKAARVFVNVIGTTGFDSDFGIGISCPHGKIAVPGAQFCFSCFGNLHDKLMIFERLEERLQEKEEYEDDERERG